MKASGRENRSMAPQIFRNFSFLAIGKTLGDAFTFLLFVVLSQTFGQEGIGQYSFAMALTGFFVVFADFGLYNLSIKGIKHGCGETLLDRFRKSLLISHPHTC
jgi:O-antigen/teichoic acid export membrane protein